MRVRATLKTERTIMPKSVCPACGKTITLEGDEAALYERVCCPNCDVLLEVIDEDPLMLEEAMDD